MKKLIVLLLVVILGLALMYGCGKQEAEPEADTAPAEVQETEMVDSTVVDSAAMEADSTAIEPDSM